jgi:hypothetical protein
MTARPSVRVLALSAWTLFALPCYGGDIYVVCHPAAALNGNDVSDVFLGEKQFSGPAKLIPVDNASAQTEFLSKVVKINKNKYESLWVKRSFRDGLAIPPVKGGDAEVIAFIKNTPGAVGYVTAPVEGVKPVAKY